MEYNSARRSELMRAAWAALTPEQRNHRARGLTAWNSANSLRRKYVLDERYFDRIDTPEKAYWLGFLGADGCVTERGEVILGLAITDGAHVAAFAAAVQTDMPSQRQRYWAKGKWRERMRLVLNCKHMAEALARHGLLPRKSLILEPWNGPADLMPHYWRGLVDGDGTVSTTRNPSIGLIGTYAVTSAFGDWMRTVNPALTCTPRPRGKIWAIRANGRPSAQAIARALYGNCTIALPRKAERAMALLAAFPPIGPARDDHSPEARARRSAIHQGQVPSQENRDAHRTPEARERARLRNLGRKASDETRHKMSEGQLRRYEDPEARERMRQANALAAERRRKPRPPTPDRHCRKCGTGINHRAAQARFCEQCRPVKGAA